MYQRWINHYEFVLQVESGKKLESKSKSNPHRFVHLQIVKLSCKGEKSTSTLVHSGNHRRNLACSLSSIIAVERLMPSAPTCRPEAACVTWPRSSHGPPAGPQIEGRWLNLTNQNETLLLHIHAALKMAFVGRSYTAPWFHLLESCWELADAHSLCPKVEWESTWSLCSDEQNHHLASPWEWEGANNVFDPFKSGMLSVSVWIQQRVGRVCQIRRAAGRDFNLV